MKKEKKIDVIIGGSRDFSCSEMVRYERLKSGPGNIASQRVRRVPLRSPFPLPPISAKSVTGESLRKLFMGGCI